MKELWINDNQIIDVSMFTKFNNIEKIFAYRNLIKTMPDLSNCEILKYIDLGNNELEFSDNFYKLRNIEKLYLYGNRINRLDWVSSLKNLTYANLRENPINCDGLNSEINDMIVKGILITDYN